MRGRFKGLFLSQPDWFSTRVEGVLQPFTSWNKRESTGCFLWRRSAEMSYPGFSLSRKTAFKNECFSQSEYEKFVLLVLVQRGGKNLPVAPSISTVCGSPALLKGQLCHPD